MYDHCPTLGENKLVLNTNSECFTCGKRVGKDDPADAQHREGHPFLKVDVQHADGTPIDDLQVSFLYLIYLVFIVLILNCVIINIINVCCRYNLELSVLFVILFVIIILLI